MDIAPGLLPVAGLLGTWRGDAAGSYPTIEDFSYTDEVVFTDVGKPFLHYLQRSWGPTGAPMHTETGYLRLPAPGTAEFVLAQPMGQTELCEGTVTVEGHVVVLQMESRVLRAGHAPRRGRRGRADGPPPPFGAPAGVTPAGRGAGARPHRAAPPRRTSRESESSAKPRTPITRITAITWS
mgnify:CR=1 FL=1